MRCGRASNGATYSKSLDEAPEVERGSGHAGGASVEAGGCAVPVRCVERRSVRRRKHDGSAAAVFASSPDRPATHFVGWLDEIDVDALFRAGEVYGVTVRRLWGWGVRSLSGARPPARSPHSDTDALSRS
jgi:hypothetical protein